jgi:hypothetical protein
MPFPLLYESLKGALERFPFAGNYNQFLHGPSTDQEPE